MPDWHKTKWRRPPKITVDAGREAQNEREDVKNGLMTLEEHYSARGKDYRREITQKAEEVRYMLDECARLSIPAEALSINLKSAVFAGGKGNTDNPQTTASLISGKQLRRPNGQFGGSDGTGGKNKSTPATRAEAENGAKAALDALKKGKDVKAAMRTRDGVEIDFEQGNHLYGLAHISQRAQQRLEVFKDGMTTEKILKGVCNAIANATPKSGRIKKRKVYEYDGFRALTDENKKGREILISGYDINENKR